MVNPPNGILGAGRSLGQMIAEYSMNPMAITLVESDQGLRRGKTRLPDGSMMSLTMSSFETRLMYAPFVGLRDREWRRLSEVVLDF